MFLVQFLLVLFARPLFAATPGCEARLAITLPPSGVQIESEALAKMANLLDLSPEERTSLQSYAAFVATVLDARAQGRPILTLHSPYLAFQSGKLHDLLARFIAAWPERQKYIQNMMERPINTLQAQIEELEAALRKGKGAQAVERNKNSMRDLLNRVSQRLYGEDANMEDFSFAINAISENPEGQLFRMKQSLVTLQKTVEERKALSAKNAERALDVLQRIDSILEKRGDDIDYQTFLQLEIAVAAIDEFESRGFLTPYEKSRDTDMNLYESYGIEFDKIEAGLKAWFSGVTKNIGGELYTLVKERIEDTKKSGMVILPIIGIFSHKESLALAFLPIRPVRLQNERSWVSDMHPGPQRGAPVTTYDLSGTNDPSGYGNNGLHTRNPQLWIETINRTFNTWFLLLGGNSEGSSPPLGRANPEIEAVLRGLLYTARYMGVQEEAINWSQVNPLLSYFFRDYISFSKHELFNPNILAFFRSDAPEFFADIGIHKPAGETELTQVLDKLIARLAHHPDLDLEKDPQLKALLERFPTTAYTAKILVLRAISGDKKPPPKRGGPGRIT